MGKRRVWGWSVPITKTSFKAVGAHPGVQGAHREDELKTTRIIIILRQTGTITLLFGNYPKMPVIKKPGEHPRALLPPVLCALGGSGGRGVLSSSLTREER